MIKPLCVELTARDTSSSPRRRLERGDGHGASEAFMLPDNPFAAALPPRRSIPTTQVGVIRASHGPHRRGHRKISRPVSRNHPPYRGSASAIQASALGVLAVPAGSEPATFRG
jgi:hypothetical protein